MNGIAKRILKRLKVYHLLQSFYRSKIDFFTKKLYQITYLKYKGKGFICNYCGSTYEKFVPELPSNNIKEAININQVIAGYGENVFCPNCMSKNRERLILAVLQKMIVIDNTLILHFSPEQHLHSYLKSKANVTTVDLMPEFYKSIEKSIYYADATNLRFKDETFDIVVANHILEHIPEDLKAIKEINRVLKKGGLAILQVPYSEKLETTIEDSFINEPKIQEQLYGQKDHVRIYSLENYLKRLEMGGFKTKILTADYLKIFAVHAIQEKECVILNYK